MHWLDLCVGQCGYLSEGGGYAKKRGLRQKINRAVVKKILDLILKKNVALSAAHHRESRLIPSPAGC